MTLTAVPAAESALTGWSGACSGTGACQLTMNADQKVTATFAAKPPPPICKLTPKGHTVSVAKTRKASRKPKPVAGTLTLTVSCDQAAVATVTGTITEALGKRPHHGKRRPRTFKLGPVTSPLRSGVATTLKLKLPASALTALVRNVRESVTFVLSVSTATGTTRTTATIAKLTSAAR